MNSRGNSFAFILSINGYNKTDAVFQVRSGVQGIAFQPCVVVTFSQLSKDFIFNADSLSLPVATADRKESGNIPSRHFFPQAAHAPVTVPCKLSHM